MGGLLEEDTNFTGQPVFNQLLRLITRQAVERLSHTTAGSNNNHTTLKQNEKKHSHWLNNLPKGKRKKSTDFRIVRKTALLQQKRL
ncbi:hypothetical protein FACS189429_5170 [Bacteroidia bacterium]|nr:hypothetical protein FACS189429_5170 [Bacteroidia bacterium]